MYDYCIVGAGLYGATFARLAAMNDKKVLVLEQRGYYGGNCADKRMNNDILVHLHGAHIFHTSDADLWKFVNQFETFVPFQNNVKAFSHSKLYSLPFNLNTLNQVFGTIWPSDAIKAIEDERRKYANIKPKNLEEQALKLVGKTIYELLIRDYTEKQWGRKCTELSPEIIKRLPVRMTYDNNYFNDTYQGLPINGYSAMVIKMLSHHLIDVELNIKFSRWLWENDLKHKCKKLVYTGAIDEYFDYQFGRLEYRTCKFITHTLQTSNYQGCPVLNSCDNTVAYTRSIEHKRFLKTESADTIVTFEYPKEYEDGDERYYPINNEENDLRYTRYKNIARIDCKDVIFGGRLGTYKYLNMDQVMLQANDDYVKDCML